MTQKLIPLLLCLLCVLCGSRASAADRKPNVLLILSDDLGAYLGTYGQPTLTPNIDALAKQGVRLDRVYCQFPLCGPSRCSFMTGLRPDTTGVIVNGQTPRHFIKDVVTLPELFRHNGYYVARAGKVYHLGIPNQVGQPGPDDPQSWDHTFDPKGNEYPSLDDGDQFDPNPKNGQSFRRNLLKDPDGKSQADYQIANETIRLLNEHKDGDKPFFLTCGFIRPHVPEVAPKKFFDLYPLSSVHLPDNPKNDADDVPPIAYYHKDFNFGMNEADSIESKRAYFATISFMDTQAGRVLAELDRLGLRDNTIVVFMADHGYLLGQHFAWQKMLLFEDSCRVPMIFSYPGMPARGVGASGLAESIDMYPTVCDLAGVQGPTELEGRSLRPLLEHPDQPFKEAAYTMVTRKGPIGRSVRTDRFRYTEWDHGNQGAELYDHRTDPREYTNLAKDPKFADTVAELQALLHAHSPKTEATRAPAKNTKPGARRANNGE